MTGMDKEQKIWEQASKEALSALLGRVEAATGLVETIMPKEEEARIARLLYSNGMRCNCDLDNWEPERSTGHSWVCRIHKAAVEICNNQPRGLSASEAPISAEAVNPTPTQNVSTTDNAREER